MNICTGSGILPGMDISALNTTNDIEKLRAMALAMMQKVIEEKERELQAKNQRIQLLEEMLKLAHQQRFGKKCETLAGMQRSLFEEDVDADIAALTANLEKLLPQSPEENEKAPRSRPVRKPLPDHLPRVEKIIRPDTDHCPECDEPLHHIRDAVSEKLEYIPAHFVVNRYIRPQYSCPCCQKVFSGEMPDHILPKSAVEPSVIAQVVINKHCDHQPLYRQRPIFARSDVDLPVSSMADMVGAAGAALSPLAALLHRELLSRPVVHADETTLKILDTKKGGKACSGYLWAYVSGERSGSQIVCFDCRTGRSHEYPENWLQGWRGTLVVDGYKAYRTLANKVPEITLAGCWAHARRGFADLYKISKDPRAAIAVKKIAGLYRLEKKISSRPVEKIRQWRQRYARPIQEDLWSWLEEQEPKCSPGRALHKAIVYALSHRVELSCFLDDGAVPLDNNVCERAIKNVVLGRKSWLFAGSLMAGERAAQIMSLLETAKRNGLEPHAWLTDVLQRLPSWPEDRLEELLPLPGFVFSERGHT
ncbi:IS66 family transposase [Salmonella enterica subsp. diarizonae]|nr:IS66 family transposase [Salmonella enterica subsp. diarizonae]